jgi:hypothetical protein
MEFWRGTAAFQRALDAIAHAGGGTVYAPPGKYLFKGTINVPAGVTLRGSYTCMPSHVGLRNQGAVKPGDDGTALLVTAGKGNENGTPFLTLNTNSSVAGITIFYPEQVTDSAPIPYPWTIVMRGKNPAIRGCEFRENKRHISLGEAMHCAIISGNILKGTAQIATASQVNVQIGSAIHRRFQGYGRITGQPDRNPFSSSHYGVTGSMRYSWVRLSLF